MSTEQAIRFASAISGDDETAEALEDILGELRDQLGARADLVLVFASAHHRSRFGYIAERLLQVLDPRVILGVTAGGVIGSGRELEKRAGLSLLAGSLPGATLHAFSYDQIDWPAAETDTTLLRRGVLGSEHAPDPAAILLFADPFSTPMVKLMPALNAALPGVPIIGGMASGAANPGDNRLLLDDRVFMDGAVGVAIGGPVRVDCTVSQGCRPIGEPWIITRARHNVIQEIGRRPVIKALEDTAQAASEEERRLLQTGGILIGRVINEYKDRFGRGDFLIRSIVGADRESGYIAVNDLVKVGQTIQFHVRDAQTAEEDLRLLLEQQRLHGEASGALLCTCNGRGSHMFTTPNAESQIIRRAIGEVPMAGFFAAGEIGPIGHQNFVHGFTASLAVFRPASGNGDSHTAQDAM
jgi:small ligand-binding sensory domain FIST